MPPHSNPSPELREFVHRMGRARDKQTRVYMPAALLAVLDLAEQGRVTNGVVRVENYVKAFKRLMLEVWPTREDKWFRPMLHCKEHGMWRPLLQSQEIPYDKRKTSSLSEARASKVADELRLDHVLLAALAWPQRRDELRCLVYELLKEDHDERSTKLADAHAHLDASQPDSDQLRELLAYEHRLQDRDAFEDLRLRQPAHRIVRQGQPEFRQRLLDAYDNRCCMSGADAPRALEAAHIFPFRGEHTNRVTNGLLLRSDLHTLFDDGLVTVDVRRDLVLELHRDLSSTVHYSEFEGRTLRRPKRVADHPDREALDWHHRKNRPWCNREHG
jgi:predicted restriction endonuclease